MNRERFIRVMVTVILVLVVALTVIMTGAAVFGMLRAHLGL